MFYAKFVWKPLFHLKTGTNPKSLQTDLTAHEMYILNLLAKSKSGTFVEIGSYLGASAIAITDGINNKPNSKLYCIDTWKNDAMTEGQRDTYHIFEKNIIKYKDKIIPCRGLSKDMSQKVSGKVNLLFIDGDHSYEGVKTDVQYWFPKLDDEAIVIFHDSGWAEGVQRIIKEEVSPISKREFYLKNLYWAHL